MLSSLTTDSKYAIASSSIYNTHYTFNLYTSSSSSYHWMVLRQNINTNHHQQRRDVWRKNRCLTPAYQTHLARNWGRRFSETGFWGNFLASRDGAEEFHHFKILALWAPDMLQVATICNFSNVISGTSFMLQCLSTYTNNTPNSPFIVAT